MQSLFSLFRRSQAATISANSKTSQQPAKAPVPLANADLKQVAGGLPAVGGL